MSASQTTPRTGRSPAALAAWRRELADGTRTTTTFDALWRAACAERSAEEFIAMVLPLLAESSLAEARRIIAAARKGRAA